MARNAHLQGYVFNIDIHVNLDFVTPILRMN
jgi:hypothetical protein